MAFDVEAWLPESPYENSLTGEIKYLSRLDLVFFDDLNLRIWIPIKETESIKILYKKILNNGI